MKTRVTLIAIALTASVAVMSAQDKKIETAKTPSRTCYVDANKNGVCDSYEDKSCTIGNGKGLRDGSGMGQGLRDGSGRETGYRNHDGSGRKHNSSYDRRHDRRHNDGYGQRNNDGYGQRNNDGYRRNLSDSTRKHQYSYIK